MKVFYLLFFTLWCVTAYSQQPATDTTGLQKQIKLITSQLDSLKVVATRHSEEMNKKTHHCSDLTTQIQKLDESRQFDTKRFIDTFSRQVVYIMTGRTDATLKNIQQLAAFEAAWEKAWHHTADQQKLLDSLRTKYITTNKWRLQLQDQFNEALISIDNYMSTLDELNKKAGTKKQQPL